MDKNIFFGSLATDEIGGELMRRVEAYYDYIFRIGRLDLWRRSREQYNIVRKTGGEVLEKGPQGEYLRFDVNHYASIIANLLGIVTSQKVAWDPKAANTDFRSQVQTVLAKGLLDYYIREKRLDGELVRACEFAVLYGESGILVEWDPLAGDLHTIEPAPSTDVYESGMEMESAGGEEVIAPKPKKIFKGDIAASIYSPIDIIRQPVSKIRFADHPWVIIRQFKNKFEIADKFNEYADEIVEMSYKRDWGKHDYIEAGQTNADYDCENDEIPMYKFFHGVTPLLPEGRMIEFLTDDIVLTDSPLPYERMPLTWMPYLEDGEAPFGYSPIWDLLPIQKVVSSVYSTVATNHKNFGLNILAVPRGPGWDVDKAANGLSVIQVDPKLPDAMGPKAISLLGSQVEAMNFLADLVHAMETISGVNSVARGNPEASLKSGSSLALVQSMAIQFSQSLQKTYYRTLEAVGTTMISHLKAFANVPRIAEIVGRSKRGVMMEFSSKDIGGITRVLVDAGNPLSKTLSGRVNLVELLLHQGTLKDPKALMQVAQTGSLESVMEGEMSEILLLKSENEALEDGSYVVQPMITDNHLMHISDPMHGHSSVLSSPSARSDPELVERVTAHLLGHIKILMDPANSGLLAALGQQSMAPPPAPPGANGGKIGAAVNAENPEQAAGREARMPSMPDNALTGDQFNQQDGGL